MASQNLGKTLSIDAGADLSADQFKFVTLAGVLAGAGARGYVLQDKPSASGQAASIALTGLTKIKAGASFSADVALTSDAAGLAVAATATDEINGHSKTAAGAANEIATMIAAQAGKEA